MDNTRINLNKMQEKVPTRPEVFASLTKYYESGDLSFIEAVNTISFAYKVSLKNSLNLKAKEDGK